jgi:prepilin peptidase CpaA
MDIFALTLKCFVLLLVLFAAYEDFRHLKIRNEICIAIAALFIPFAFSLTGHELLLHGIAGLIIFVVTAGMFFARLFGGGDAKLLAALALWYPLSGLPAFLMTMALAGGVVAIIAIILKKTKIPERMRGPEDGWLAALARGETIVPYGIAIAFAAALTFF